MKTRITTLRRIAERLNFAVYTESGNWILSATEREALHYSVRSEREALLVGLNRAVERDMLTDEERDAVQSA